MISLIGKKIGMNQLFGNDGEVIPITIVNDGPCPVVNKREKERDGYNAIVIGFGEKNNPTRPYSGLFKKSGVKPARFLMEIRGDFRNLKIGDWLDVDLFSVGDKVNITAISKGKGFQGVVKRHGFSGGPKTHGSKSGRIPGSIGSSATPGRVLKGKKLPGRMGGKRVTVKNLSIVKIDKEENLIYVKGALPGATGGTLLIKRLPRRLRGA
jgi:large subunit ribosomal protein L3